MAALGVALSLFALLQCTIVVQSSGDQQLLFLHMVWRHGDRSPTSTFPTNPDPSSSWPNGLGELTDLGMRQHYKLGSYLRQRYAEFLPKIGLPNSIYVRSTDFNRTIMSALTNLAGMFPPDVEHQWNRNLTWQPIPVHTEPSDLDSLLNMGANCPKAETLRHQTWQSAEAMAVMQQNEQLISLLRNKTGLKFTTLDDIRLIHDPLNCARIHNKSHVLPDWLTENLFLDIVRLFKISTTFWVRDEREQQLRGAMLVDEITKRMTSVYYNNQTSAKLYAYSAHDETLVALLQNLHVYNMDMFPIYTSVVIFELVAINGRPYVQVLLKVGASENVKTLKLPFCDNPCPLDVFTDHFADVAPTNWRRECGLQTAVLAWRSYALIAFSLAAVAIGVAIAQTLYFVAMQRRNRDQSYSPLDSDGN